MENLKYINKLKLNNKPNESNIDNSNREIERRNIK